MMDNLSSDDTVPIAKSYDDSRIRISSEPDKGIYDAMNKGIKKSHGEWLYFLGSDDYLLNNTVLAQVNKLIPDKCDVFYGDIEAPQLDKRHKGEWKIDDLEYNRCHQAIFYNKSIFKKLDNYNLKYKILADQELNLRWFLNRHILSVYYPVRIAHYSDMGFSSKASDQQFIDDFPYLVLRHGWGKLNKTERRKYTDEIKRRFLFGIKWRKDKYLSAIINIFR